MTREWYRREGSWDRYILAGDVGGTNTNLGLVGARGDRLELLFELETPSKGVTDFPSLVKQTLAEFEDDFGYACPYRDMDGFFTLLKSQGTAINLLSLVGLGDVRAKIVGLDNRPAAKDEIVRMQREAALAIEQGCFGASTGLEYTPGSFASTEELIEVMKGIPEKHRLYATHMRNEDNRVLEAIEEAIAIARGSGSRLQVSHLKAQNRANWPKQAAAIALLEKGIVQGMEIHTDRYPYVA